MFPRGEENSFTHQICRVLYWYIVGNVTEEHDLCGVLYVHTPGRGYSRVWGREGDMHVWKGPRRKHSANRCCIVSYLAVLVNEKYKIANMYIIVNTNDNDNIPARRSERYLPYDTV